MDFEYGFPLPSEIIRYKLPTGERVKKGTPGARKVKERASKWYAIYLDAKGDWKRKALCRDKSAAQTMLDELTRKEDRKRAGRIDAFDEHFAHPVAKHLADYKAHLSGKRSTSGHVARQFSRISKICEACGFRRLSDIQASAVSTYLEDSSREHDWSLATRNHWLVAIKGFARWLAQDRRLPSDPLSHLSRLNPKTDVRRERRILEEAEFAALVAAAKTGAQFRGLSGESRAMLYILAANTGLRASELASLSPASFDLRWEPPTVTVDAAYSKHRRRDVLPLRQDLLVRHQA